MKRRGVAAALSLALVAGGAGCSRETPESRPSHSASPSVSQACGRIATPKFLADTPSNGVIPAENTGECAYVVGDDLRTIGSIATGQEFDAICLTGPKPPGIAIKFNEARGEVHLNDEAIKDLLGGKFPKLPECPTTGTPLPSMSP